MEPKRYARTVWFGITVFFAVLVQRSYALATHNPYPPGYQGVRCGTGAIAVLFAGFIFAVLGLISLVVFFSRKKS
ncbi:MAG TPA: hypothetical protein VGM90_19790 [Kofleriaceae bacterium]|jgi:hypothetical protein